MKLVDPHDHDWWKLFHMHQCDWLKGTLIMTEGSLASE